MEPDQARNRILGRTGLIVRPLGVASSFGVPTESLEEAFEKGVNYFYWGSLRKDAMARAIRNIVAKGRRDDLVIVLQSYSRIPTLMEGFFERGLKTLGIDRAEILLLGWYNQTPSPRTLDRALKMQEKGLFRFLGLSGHNRRLFPELARDERFQLFHVRYNAAHRGAEIEVFDRLPDAGRPGLVTYTATRWGDLLKPEKMPPGETPLRAADCYRFCMSHPRVDVCICGPKNKAEMREALTALEAGPLAEEELTRIRGIGDYLHERHRRLAFR